jgi:hypothetical protein
MQQHNVARLYHSSPVVMKSFGDVGKSYCQIEKKLTQEPSGTNKCDTRKALPQKDLQQSS